VSTPIGTPPDDALVRSAQGGDAHAFAALVERHLGLVFTIALARLGSREAAEDLTQEVFLRVQIHLGTLDLTRPLNFPAWLSHVTRNLTAEWQRRDTRRSRLVAMVPLDEETQHRPDTDQRGARETMETEERSRLVNQVIGDLPPDQREVVLLHFAQGLTKREIARRLGVHPTTVGRQLRRALRALRGRLGPMLREAAPAMQPGTALGVRTLALVAAAGAMSAAEKATLAATVGAPVLPSAAALGVSSTLTSAMTQGGLTMSLGKAVSITVAVVALVAGGVYLATKGAKAPVAPVTPSEEVVAPPAEPAPEETPEEDMAPAPTPPPEPPPRAVVSPPLSKRIRIGGTVTDPGGNPIAEALVYLTERSILATEPLLLTQTDFEGRFEFINAHEAPRIAERMSLKRRSLWMRLVAEAPGWGRVTRRLLVKVDPDVMEELHITLQPGGTLEGRVVWESGDPVPLARVVALTPVEITPLIYVEAPEQQTIAAAMTDESGRFRLERLERGTVRVAASPPGEPLILAGDFEVSSRDVEVTLRPPEGVIIGRALGSVTRTPRANQAITLGSSHRDLWTFLESDTWTTDTDSEGRFRFEGVPTHLALRLGDGTGGTSQGVEFAAGQTLVDVTLLVPEPVRVAGEVVNTLSGDPVSGLALLFRPGTGDSVSIVTDDEGRFDLGEIPVEVQISEPSGNLLSQLSVYLSDPHYLFTPSTGPISQPHRDSLFLQVERLSEFASLRLEVEPCDVIDVRAVDPRGRPIEEAALRLAVSPSLHRSMSLNRTDARGRTQANLPVSMSGFQVYGSSERWPVVFSPVFGPASHEVVAEALPTMPLEVTVVDALGNPQLGMMVDAEHRVPIMGSLSTLSFVNSDTLRVTDAEGRVTLDPVARCPEIVFAAPEGIDMTWGISEQTLSTATIDLTDAGDAAEVTITCESFAVRGRVIDWFNSEPIAGAEVAWCAEGSTQGPVFTDAEGDFELPGTIDLIEDGFRISAPGFATYHSGRVYNHLVSNRSTAFVLYREITLRGQTLRPDGSAPPRSPLYLFLPIEDPWGPAWDVVHVNEFAEDQWTRPDGSFEWRPQRFPRHERIAEVPAWLLALTDEGELAVGDGLLHLDRPQVIEFGTLAVQPGLEFTGRILDHRGEPVEDAQVDFENHGSFQMEPGMFIFLGGRRPFGPSAVWSSRSDAEGRFELRTLPPGHWRFPVWVEGRQPEVFEIDLLDDLERDLTLSPGASMEVIARILGFDGEPLPGVDVTLQHRGSSFQRLEQRTDLAGEAHFVNVPPGRFGIDFRHEVGSARLYWSQQDVEIPSEGMEIVNDLSSWRTLQGRVVREGAPQADEPIYFLRARSPEPYVNVNAWTSTDAAGSFSLALPEASYQITVAGERQTITHPASQEIIVELEPQ
jgi:RNA polymerase sigma factor (sigma-70 family)